MKHALSRLVWLVRHGDPAVAEFYNAFVGAAWGLGLVLPWDSWGGSVLYVPLLRLAPEWAWGWAFLVLGSLQAIAALLGNRGARRLFSFTGFMQWSLVAWLFTAAGLRATATVLYGAVALGSLWVFIRIGLMAGKAGPGES